MHLESSNILQLQFVRRLPETAAELRNRAYLARLLLRLGLAEPLNTRVVLGIVEQGARDRLVHPLGRRLLRRRFSAAERAGGQAGGVIVARSLRQSRCGRVAQRTDECRAGHHHGRASGSDAGRRLGAVCYVASQRTCRSVFWRQNEDQMIARQKLSAALAESYLAEW
jgi:hypothetical protein